MNIFKKAWCRVFQTVFHMALPILPYREPRIYHDVEQLGALFEELGADRVMLVTDGQLRAAGVTARLERFLDRSGIFCAVYDKTAANPTVDNVEEARALYLREGCQCLIAFGGGSSMDCAKAVGARLAWPRRSMESLRGNLRILRKIPPLIAIPTTAGTGSEATVAAVITDAQKHHKYTMNDFSLIPRYVVHDPAVTYSLPPHVTATTGMDALTHAVEVYIGRSTSRETRAMAEQAVRLVFENLETAYRDGHNDNARAHMLQAAYLAGAAFSKSYVGYVHAVAHSLGGRYNMAHGLANSVLLPIFLEAYGPVIHRPLAGLARVAGLVGAEADDETAAGIFIAEVRAMNRRMGIPEKLSGIRAEDIPAMAKHADAEANPLYPVPVLWDRKELERFYYLAADWHAPENSDDRGKK